MPDETGPHYDIVISQFVAGKFRTLYQQAVQAGIVGQVLQAVRVILKQLRTEPLRFGEPTHHLEQLGLEIRLGVVSPLAVRYAVHQTLRVVFITEFKTLSSPGS
jgi:hypothetical protein